MERDSSDGQMGKHTMDSIEMAYDMDRASIFSRTVAGFKGAGRTECKVGTGCSTKGTMILKGNGQKDSCSVD
jgi:hypothetical protein